MSDNDSNSMAIDTPESLKAEREDLEKTVACVRQISQDFRTMAEQEKSLDVERIAFHLQLTGPDMRRCVWKGILSPEGFQWHKEAMARQKVLGEQLIKDTAALVQALIEWAEDLEKREKQQQQPVLSPAPSVPIVTGRNGRPTLDESAAPEGANEPASVEKSEQRQQQPSLSSVPSIPIITGGNAQMPDEFAVSPP